MTQIINNHVCRLCGGDKGIFINIFDSTPDSLLKIEAVVPDVIILRYDNLPKVACHRCISKVNEFYEFKKTCVYTQKALKEKLPWIAYSPKDGLNAPTEKPLSPMVTFMGGPLAHPYGDPESEVEVLVLSDDEDLGTCNTSLQPHATSVVSRPQQQKRISSTSEVIPTHGYVTSPSYFKKKGPSPVARVNSRKRTSLPRAEAVGTPDWFVPLTQPKGGKPSTAPPLSTSIRRKSTQASGPAEGAHQIPLKTLAKYQQSLQSNSEARPIPDSLISLPPPSKQPCLQVLDQEKSSNNRIYFGPISQTTIQKIEASSSAVTKVPVNPHGSSSKISVSGEKVVNYEESLTRRPPAVASRNSKSLTLASPVSRVSPGACPPSVSLNVTETSVGKLDNKVASPSLPIRNSQPIPQTSRGAVGLESKTEKTICNSICHPSGNEMNAIPSENPPKKEKISHYKPKPKSKKKHSGDYSETEVRRICDTYPLIDPVKINEKTTIFPCRECNKILMSEDAIARHDCVTAILEQEKLLAIKDATSDKNVSALNHNDDSNHSTSSSVELIISDGEGSNHSLATQHTCQICTKQFHNLARLEKHLASHKSFEASSVKNI